MMSYFKISIGILIALAASRIIPHPPNFTSLVALSFYVPALFGRKYIFSVIFAFFITDLIIGIHSNLIFTYGSVFLIGFLANYFNKSLTNRIVGVLLGSFIFYIISNFGVWLTSGFYPKTIDGIIYCYFLALPFFGNTVISTLIYSAIIETISSYYKNIIKNKFKY